MQVIVASFPYQEPPCPGAVKHLGEWGLCKREVRGSFRWGNAENTAWTNEGLSLKAAILDTPDSEIKRYARLDGDVLYWESRERWWTIEVRDLEHLMEILADGGNFEADEGRPYIEFDRW